MKFSWVMSKMPCGLNLYKNGGQFHKDFKANNKLYKRSSCKNLQIMFCKHVI